MKNKGLPFTVHALAACFLSRAKATNPSGSQFFYDNAGSTDKTLKLYEGHYHDLLNDLDKEVVMADITGWIVARVPAIQTQSAAV